MGSLSKKKISKMRYLEKLWSLLRDDDTKMTDTILEFSILEVHSPVLLTQEKEMTNASDTK